MATVLRLSMNSLKRTRSSFLNVMMIASATAITLIAALNVRPLADDYCIAAGMVDGPWAAFLQTFQNWTGDLVQIATSITLVGLPIYLLPYSLYALVPIFVSVMLLTFVSYFLFSNLINASLSKISLISVSYFFVALFWPTYWVAQRAFDKIPNLNLALRAEESSKAALQWSTVISQYLIVPLLLVLLFIVCAYKNSRKTIYLECITVGILVGLSGYAFAASLVVFSVFKLAANRFKNYKVIISLCGGVCLALFISLNSAGAKHRASSIGIDSLGELNLIRFATRYVSELISSCFNLGIFTIFALGFVISIKYSAFWKETVSTTLWLFSWNLLIFAFIYFSFIKLSEIFSYIAFWHLITFKGILFFASFALGMQGGLASHGKLKFYSKSIYLKIVVVFLISITSVSILLNLLEIENRADKWGRGPAGVKGIADIDPANYWVVKCWNVLRVFKDSPQR